MSRHCHGGQRRSVRSARRHLRSRPRPAPAGARRLSRRPVRAGCAPVRDADPMPGRIVREPSRRRPQSAGPGGEPAAAPGRPAARRALAHGRRRRCAARRSTRSGASKSRRERRACRTRSSLAARYALCAALDEAVLSTPWGAQSEWAQHPLLVALHREAWGGEKFFEMLERISADPARHIDLMELQYLVLALGFAGKYQVQERGHAQLAEVQQRSLPQDPQAPRHAGAGAVAALARPGGSPQSAHSLRAVVGGRRGRARRPGRGVHLFTTRGSATVADAGARGAGDDRHRRLRGAAGRSPSPGPTLKQLLAPDEAQRRADAWTRTAADASSRSCAADLFASGSADGESAHHETLQHVAAAINQVPGRVLVVGHTDDQPLSRCATATTTSCRASAPSAS